MKISPSFLFLCALLPSQASVGHAQLTEQVQLTASDAQDYDWFGQSVSISGDTVVVGADYEDPAGLYSAGSAYVFVRRGTTWTEQAKLTASDGAELDHFGRSVSVCGDTAVVGSYRDDHSGRSEAGSAYVFVRNGTTWTRQAKLIASDAREDDYFGVSVSVSGDTVLVGTLSNTLAGGWASSPGASHRGLEKASVYVFVRNGTTWTEQAILTAGDWALVGGNRVSSFGYSVSISGDTAVVGAFGDDPAGIVGAGSAYVFVRNGTAWTEQAKLTASDLGTSFGLGTSITVHGDTALVGARGHYLVPGAAYVFTRTGTTWSQQARLTASSASSGDSFGSSVSMHGDTAVIGATQAGPPGGPPVGAAYLFHRAGTTWTEQARLAGSDVAAWNRFGTSVAVQEGTAVVGNVEDRSGPGSAYVYYLKQALATPRNAGSNPASYTASAPVLGGTFTGTIDLTTTGHGFALLFGFDSPVTQTLAGGQILLCSPLLGKGELLNQSAMSGPVAAFSVAVPNDLGLCGLKLCTQALHFGGVNPFALSNAQDLVVGLY
jgi:hypothetical protein